MQILDHYTSVFSVLGIICEDTVFVRVVIEYTPIMIESMVYSITVRNFKYFHVCTLKCLNMRHSNNKCI